MTRVKVLGLGNVLMRDDGVGPHVVRVLDAGWEMPPGVTVEDLGTPGLDLHPHVADADALVVVDAARTDERPGTVRTWDGAALLGHTARPRLGPHDPGLEGALRTLLLCGGGPTHVRLVGVVPGRVEHGLGLTPEVLAAVPRAVGTILAELEALGVPAAPREPPGTPDLWWLPSDAAPAGGAG